MLYLHSSVVLNIEVDNTPFVHQFFVPLLSKSVQIRCNQTQELAGRNNTTEYAKISAIDTTGDCPRSCESHLIREAHAEKRTRNICIPMHDAKLIASDDERLLGTNARTSISICASSTPFTMKKVDLKRPTTIPIYHCTGADTPSIEWRR